MNLNELKNNFEPISKNLPKIPSNYQKKLLQLVENLSLSKQKFLRGEDLKQVDKIICDHNKSESIRYFDFIWQKLDKWYHSGHILFNDKWKIKANQL